MAKNEVNYQRIFNYTISINNNFIQLLTTSTVECVWEKNWWYMHYNDKKKSDFMSCTYSNQLLFRYTCSNILYTGAEFRKICSPFQHLLTFSKSMSRSRTLLLFDDYLREYFWGMEGWGLHMFRREFGIGYILIR